MCRPRRWLRPWWGNLPIAHCCASLARRCEVLSFDWENISAPALRAATRGLRTRIAPPLRALATGQDRLAEKRLFERLGVRTTRYAAVASRADLQRACQRIGIPGMLKTRRMGYDGKGQMVIRDGAGIGAAWSALGGVPLLYEELVDFEAEVSALAVRARDGAEAHYPLTRNWHAARHAAPERGALGSPGTGTPGARVHARRVTGI